MFLMIGINPGSREIQYDRVFICERCGAYGRYRVTMTYMCLSLFFIPVFKWDRRYIVESRCCGTRFLLDPAIGARIARGEDIEILPEHLTPIDPSDRDPLRRCGRCGYTTREDFDFCPKCGNRM